MPRHFSVVEIIERGATVEVLRRLMAIVALSALAGLVLIAWYEFQRTTAHAVRGLNDIRRMAEEHARAVLADNDRALDLFGPLVDGRSTHEIALLERVLHDKAARAALASQYIENITIWDDDGRPLASGRHYPISHDVEGALRIYGTHKVQGIDRYVVNKHHCSRSGRAVDRVIVSRSRRDPTGAFGGVITSAFSPDVFTRHYGSMVPVGSDVSVELVSEDGTYIAGYSDARGATAQPYALPSDSIDSYGAFVSIGGRATHRHAVYENIEGYPLRVRVSRGYASIYAEWWHDMSMLCLIAVPGLALLLLCFELAARKARHEQSLILECHEADAHRIEAEAEVKHVQTLEALGQLTGGIAHDFNGLLQLIANGAAGLEKSMPPGQRGNPYLASIRKAVLSARELSTHLLKLSRKNQLTFECIDPRVELVGMCKFARLALPPSVTLDCNVHPNASKIYVDRAELQLALINLVVNARDAMGGKGAITVAVANVSAEQAHQLAPSLSSRDYVALSVRDTGPGIPSHVMAHMFEPFYTTKGKGSGTGLGLSRVHRYASDLGGCVLARNHVEGGAVITIYVPRAQTGQCPEQLIGTEPLTTDPN